MASSKRKRRPATTVEARENQLISSAIDLAEKQILEGTASSQVITHYLKLGSTRERLEQERLEAENAVLKARVDSMASGKRIEELYEAALNAMRNYSGQQTDDEDFDFDD
jgi:hypothetical protein